MDCKVAGSNLYWELGLLSSLSLSLSIAISQISVESFNWSLEVGVTLLTCTAWAKQAQRAQNRLKNCKGYYLVEPLSQVLKNELGIITSTTYSWANSKHTVMSLIPSYLIFYPHQWQLGTLPLSYTVPSFILNIPAKKSLPLWEEPGDEHCTRMQKCPFDSKYVMSLIVNAMWKQNSY